MVPHTHTPHTHQNHSVFPVPQMLMCICQSPCRPLCPGQGPRPGHSQPPAPAWFTAPSRQLAESSLVTIMVLNACPRPAPFSLAGPLHSSREPVCVSCYCLHPERHAATQSWAVLTLSHQVGQGWSHAMLRAQMSKLRQDSLPGEDFLPVWVLCLRGPLPPTCRPPWLCPSQASPISDGEKNPLPHLQKDWGPGSSRRVTWYPSPRLSVCTREGVSAHQEGLGGGCWVPKKGDPPIGRAVHRDPGRLGAMGAHLWEDGRGVPTTGRPPEPGVCKQRPQGHLVEACGPRVVSVAHTLLFTKF